MADRTYGLQLFTVPHLLQVEFEGTLDRIARLGYEELEFFGPFDFSPPATRRLWRSMADAYGLDDSGYYGRDPEEVGELLSERGLSAPSVHLHLATLREALEPAMETARRVGHETLVLSFLPAAARSSIDDYRRLADELNELGERTRSMGLQLAYHNHCFEFGHLEGDVPYRILLEETETELLTLELDVFWAATAGYEPADLLETYPDRFSLLHLKDRAEDWTADDPLRLFENPDALRTAFGNLADVGSGITDFPAVLETADEAGVAHYLVERDVPEDQAGTIERSIEYLRGL